MHPVVIRSTNCHDRTNMQLIDRDMSPPKNLGIGNLTCPLAYHATPSHHSRHAPGKFVLDSEDEDEEADEEQREDDRPASTIHK